METTKQTRRNKIIKLLMPVVLSVLLLLLQTTTFILCNYIYTFENFTLPTKITIYFIEIAIIITTIFLCIKILSIDSK